MKSNQNKSDVVAVSAFCLLVAIIAASASGSAQTVSPIQFRYLLDGVSAGDQLGASIEGPIDLNADGVMDLVVGAINTAGSGRVRAYSGSTQMPLWTLTPVGQVGDTAGGDICILGDVDGDGQADLAVGAPQSFGNRGAAAIVSLATQSVIRVIPGVGSAPDDRFGNTVQAVGDINGDGISDYVITASSADPCCGHYVGTINAYSGANNAVFWQANGAGSFDYCGRATDTLDMDGDGVREVINCAPESYANSGPGYVRLHNGRTGAIMWQHSNSVAVDDRFGSNACFVDDVNSDGVRDVAVVAPGADLAGANLGRIDLISGANGALLWRLPPPAGATQFGLGGWESNAIISVPDLDGDGVDDIAVGMPNAAVGGVACGVVVVVGSVSGNELARIAGSEAGEQFGAVIARVDGLLGGGSVVMAVGAPLRDQGRGQVRVYEWLQDCNGNGIDDQLDISSGAAADCNLNGRPDSCEPLTLQTDCDSNGLLDVCQLQNPANDCNTNGQLDVCETAAGTALDCNLNSRPDSCDLAAGAPDCNLNQIPDSCDLGTGVSFDTDFNSIPDECSLDCNGNGLLDTAECLQGLVADCNANLVPDTCDVAGAVPDCNANGVPDSCDVATGGDCNGNNTPDVCDLAAGAPDCNGNGLLDACDLAAGAADCDANLVPDVCQALDASSDCNANMVLDVCDILAGAPDCNANGRPDSCEPDTNNDGVADDCQDGGTPFCFGDGTANSTPCPCGGVGAPRSGCPNSANPLGGYLAAVGLPSRTADTLVLRGSQMPPIATVLYFQGTSQATAAGGTIGTVFGDGLRCASGAVLRLGFRTNVGGASELPSGGSPALHIVGQIPASGAVTRYYQGWYRDASPTFCTTNRYNLTNGVAVVWVP